MAAVAAQSIAEVQALCRGALRHDYRWPKDQDRLVAKFKKNLASSGLLEESRVKTLIEAIERFDECGSTAGFITEWRA